MSNLDLARGRSTVLNLTNKSGTTRSPGDVVILDTANDESFTTSNASNTIVPLGVVDETIGIGSNGRVVVEGYARAVATIGTTARGDYLYQSTTAYKAANMAGTAIAGAFGYVEKGGSGATTTALIFPTIQVSGSLAIGSNSTDVSGASALGGLTSYAPSSHTHKGVFAVTSSSSNTLEVPTVNIRPGANVAITATDTNGNGFFDTLTIHSTATGGGGGGGGGTGYGNLAILDIIGATAVGTWGLAANTVTLFAQEWQNSTHAQNDALTWTRFFPAGTYSIAMHGLLNVNRAISTFKIDGSSVGTMDWYNGSLTSDVKIITGVVVATSGSHTIQMIAATRNASANDWYIGWSYINIFQTA